jgi:hypothetical protein
MAMKHGTEIFEHAVLAPLFQIVSEQLLHTHSMEHKIAALKTEMWLQLG